MPHIDPLQPTLGHGQSGLQPQPVQVGPGVVIQVYATPEQLRDFGFIFNREAGVWTSAGFTPPGNPPGGGTTGGGGGGFSGPPGPGDPGYDPFSLSAVEKDQLLHAYWMVGKSFGYNFDRGRLEALLRGAVSPDELRMRLTAIDRVKEYQVAFNQFNAVLRARGEKPLTRKGAVEFLLGLGSPKFRQIWEEVSTRTAAVTADFKVFNTQRGLERADAKGLNEDLALTRQNIMRLLKKLPGELTEEQANAAMQEAARIALEHLPEARFAGLGLNKQQVLNITHGVAGAKTLDKFRRLMETEAAFFEERAGMSLQQTQQGTTVAGLQGLAGAASA